MAAAGESAIAGRIPGERIATQIDTADTATFTTVETVVSTVTAALVSGRTYRVRSVVTYQSDVADDHLNARLREDSVSGTQMTGKRVRSTLTTGGFGFDGCLEAEYTAVSTGNKTFVATGVRSTGTGNWTGEGLSVQPRYLYVDYIRG